MGSPNRDSQGWLIHQRYLKGEGTRREVMHFVRARVRILRSFFNRLRGRVRLREFNVVVRRWDLPIQIPIFG